MLTIPCFGLFHIKTDVYQSSFLLKEMFNNMALVTGNRCIRGNFIADNGTVVHDSHAEILTRRAFKR